MTSTERAYQSRQLPHHAVFQVQNLIWAPEESAIENHELEGVARLQKYPTQKSSNMLAAPLNHGHAIAGCNTILIKRSSLFVPSISLKLGNIFLTKHAWS
jgi:hypothetical protein